MKKPKKISETPASYKVEKERLNLYLPKPLVEKLRESIPARERTQFIADLLERELYRLRVREAWRLSAGAWCDEDYPELTTGEDIDRWIEEGRKSLERTWIYEDGN